MLTEDQYLYLSNQIQKALEKFQDDLIERTGYDPKDITSSIGSTLVQSGIALLCSFSLMVHGKDISDDDLTTLNNSVFEIIDKTLELNCNVSIKE